MTVAFTLRALLARGPRTLITALTVAFGVAIVTGALVFTDTTHAAYGRLFASADRGAQLIVSARQSAGTRLASASNAAQTSGAPAIAPAVLARIRAVPGVSAAAGQIIAPATIVGSDGRPLNASPETVAISKLPAPFNGIHYTSGTAPRHADEVAIDASTAAQQHFAVGDTVRIVTGQPAARFFISGIASLGSAGGERFAVFTPNAAHRLYASADVSQVDVAVAPAADRARVAEDIAARLPTGLVVQSQVTQVQAAVSRISSAFSTLSDGLLAFAVVAVLIGALVIFNTFATTATQRQRELALLRALGATRLQVVVAGLVEALAIGVLGAVLGVIAGPFVALAVRGVFAGAGVGVAAGALSVSARAIGIGLGVGIVVSLLAALVPALAARRATPVEALATSYGAQALGTTDSVHAGASGRVRRPWGRRPHPHPGRHRGPRPPSGAVWHRRRSAAHCRARPRAPRGGRPGVGLGAPAGRPDLRAGARAGAAQPRPHRAERLELDDRNRPGAGHQRLRVGPAHRHRFGHPRHRGR